MWSLTWLEAATVHLPTALQLLPLQGIQAQLQHHYQSKVQLVLSQSRQHQLHQLHQVSPCVGVQCCNDGEALSG